LTDRTGAHDARKAEPHLRAFLVACPSSPDGLALLRTTDSVDLLATGAATLRRGLEALPDNWSLPYWVHLWNLETRSTPSAGQATMKDRVLRDAKALSALTPAGTAEWQWVFQQASQLTGDSLILEWLETKIRDRFPTSWLAQQAERRRWQRLHPPPHRGAAADEVLAYRDIVEAWQSDFDRRWADAPAVISTRFHDLRRPSASSLPLEERLAIIDRYLLLQARSPDAGFDSPPALLSAADYCVRWHSRLDKVAAMIHAGLQQAESQSRYQLHASMYPAEERKAIELSLEVVRAYWRGRLALADLFLEQGRVRDATDAIQAGIARLDVIPTAAAGSSGDGLGQFMRRSWILRQARLAELKGDSQVALLLCQRYLTPIGRERLAAPPDDANRPNEDSDAIGRAKALYLTNGGTEGDWLVWATGAPNEARPAAATPAPLVFDVAIPDFTVTDTDGRTWSLADLKGRATFIDVWAQWCGPCRAGHPALQRAYDRIKHRRDIQVLTLSVDENPALASAYMKNARLTFPLITSMDLADRLFPSVSIPAYWIIDALGRRSSTYGWSGDIDRLIADLERASKVR
jgi:thiol-disulfide isomerase/thioredoxin